MNFNPEKISTNVIRFKNDEDVILNKYNGSCVDFQGLSILFYKQLDGQI